MRSRSTPRGVGRHASELSAEDSRPSHVDEGSHQSVWSLPLRTPPLAAGMQKRVHFVRLLVGQRHGTLRRSLAAHINVVASLSTGGMLTSTPDIACRTPSICYPRALSVLRPWTSWAVHGTF